MSFNRYMLLPLVLLAFNASAQTTIYGLDVPLDVTKQVDKEEKDLQRDTALYIERAQRFKKYKKALREHEQENAVEKFRANKFPQFPPELITEERHRNFEYDEARKRPLFEVESTIQNIEIDPLEPATYTIEASVGEPTRLVFFDQTGAPWPVLRADAGKANRFGAVIIPEIEAGNQIAIELDDNFVRGNVLINLQDYGLPLVFRVIANPLATTPYANIRVQRYGPNGELQLSSDGIVDVAACRDVYELLESSTVTGGVKKYLSGITGNVFVTEEKTYIRSPYRMVFPPNTCSTSDGNGNWASRIDGVGHYTATFVREDGTYVPANILDNIVEANYGR